MRRAVLATAVIGSLLAASPALAAARQRSTEGSASDAKGDWAVASQDIVGIRVTSGRVDGQQVVRGVITLADAPDRLAQYTVTMDGGCEAWTLSARNIGGGDMEDVRLQHTFCANTAGVATMEPENAPATLSVSGNVVTITAPYAVGLAKGLRVSSLSGTASPLFTGAYAGNGLGQHGFVVSGDLALGAVSFVLT